MKTRMMTIVLAIAILLLILIPRISYSQTPVSPDSLCYYRQADGTIVDLRSICGIGSPPAPSSSGIGRSQPSGSVMPQAVSTNPAMKITPPNDPGVLYLSGSGAQDPAAAKASQTEKNPQR